ncbi:NAD(P)/FAD-dependent oxidoreductase [Nonomuraea sp. NPDC050328]|uniref:NAD(P)/FAD-dependent oxidoreductase n=1 Tax=Nonomuraea sp. NPDC050328 TaxID=3364361 RepID=UPI00379E5D2B
MKRVVVVGGGFGGFHCARSLSRMVPRGTAEVVVVNPTDFHLYTPLLPHVAGGLVHAPDIAVALSRLRGVVLCRGNAVDADLDAHTITVLSTSGERFELPWDRLVLAPGSVTRVFDIPGLQAHAHGFKTLTEALYLHDRVIANVERARVTADLAEREALSTFVVVGAGLAGAEFVAMAKRLATAAAPRLRTRWLLLDMAPAVLPQLGEALSAKATDALRRLGVEVRLGTSIREARPDSVTLTDGTVVPCRLLVWTAGVSASPLVQRLGLPLDRGRVVVRADLSVREHPHVYAVGDAAAVPDLTRPGGVCAQTAQHAQRQGPVAARNIAASFGYGELTYYRHRDLGMVADLGGLSAVADPMGLRLTGPPAKLVTSGYHLLALESTGNRLRVGTDWLLHALLRTVPISTGLVSDASAALVAAEQLSIYPPLPQEASAPSRQPSPVA